MEFKEKILRLLGRDREFRYAVAGLIGLDEILNRLDKHDEKFNAILSRLDEHDRKFNQIIARLEEHDRKFNEVLKRLDGHEEVLESHGEELARLRRDLNEGFNLLRRHIDALGARWGFYG